ncbi:hypothetical protein ACFFX0_12690 [Citricoccus parietis]|uniref:Uncharacterized protein n=1 Tax=Citricoccus parietis TaxID=592307 RepID=A0ABV5FZA4_9MICC
MPRGVPPANRPAAGTPSRSRTPGSGAEPPPAPPGPEVVPRRGTRSTPSPAARRRATGTGRPAGVPGGRLSPGNPPAVPRLRSRARARWPR